MADITVVIISYNRTALLSRILARLSDQTLRPRVIVSDDGTPIESWPVLLDAQVDRILWARHTTYQRVARANEGMALVETAYAILLDDDQLPISDVWIESYRAQLEQRSIVRGLGFDASGSIVPTAWWSTANLGVRLDDWQQLGGLDPAYNGNYGYEDHDFGQKVAQWGISWEHGTPLTACQHLGLPYAGDRDSREINQNYFKRKWGIT